MVGQFAVAGAQELLTGSYNIIKLKSSAHRQLSMRNDKAPFTDPRVRQAIALTLDRPAIVKALFQGFADVGNDSPFAPVFPSTNTSVAQRTQDIAKAKSLLAAAGHGSGFSTQLVTENFVEIPQYAQIVAQSAKEIGVNIGLKVESSSQYYGKATFGNSDWLDATMSLVDYGHRGVPNVFLTSPLETYNAKTGTGTVERRPLRQRAVRQAGGAVRRRFGPGHAEDPRRADRDAAAGADADHLRVLLQLPDGDDQGRDRGLPDRGRAPVPVRRREELGPPELAHSGAFGVR